MQSPCRPLSSPQVAAHTVPAVHGSSEAVLVAQTVFAELAVVLGLGALLAMLTVVDTRVAP